MKKLPSAVISLLLLTQAVSPARAEQPDASAAWEQGLQAAGPLAAKIKEKLAKKGCANPLAYQKTYVHNETMLEDLDEPVSDFWFGWAPCEEQPHPDPQGHFHVYSDPSRMNSPFILVLPFTGDPDYRISKEICGDLFSHGFRCAYMERSLPIDEKKWPKTYGGLFAHPGLPPHTIQAAMRGLDALQQERFLRPGEKIGLAGISMGAIEAADIAAIDNRVGAAVLILGGADLPRILNKIHGAGVGTFKELTEREKQDHGGLTDEEFERHMAEYTWKADPLTFYPCGNLPGEKYLMINANGDTAINKECSDKLYRAISQNDGTKPDREMMSLPFFLRPFFKDEWKHIWTLILRKGHVKKRMREHFKKHLMPREAN